MPAILQASTEGLDVPCDAGATGITAFTFRSSTAPPFGISALVMTNLETRQVVVWAYDQTIYIKSLCENPLAENSSHLIFNTDYRGGITYSASWQKSETGNDFILALSLFAFGVLLAFAFIGGIKSGKH